MRAEEILKMCPASAFLRRRREKFQNGQITQTNFILSILIGLFCIQLSWSCSSQEPTALRVMYAFFAFMFGPVYLVYWLLVRADQCRKK
jgi:hypothetical protein